MYVSRFIIILKNQELKWIIIWDGGIIISFRKIYMVLWNTLGCPFKYISNKCGRYKKKSTLVVEVFPVLLLRIELRLLHDVELQEAPYWIIRSKTVLLILTCRWCPHHVRCLLCPFILINLCLHCETVKLLHYFLFSKLR